MSMTHVVQIHIVYEGVLVNICLVKLKYLESLVAIMTLIHHLIILHAAFILLKKKQQVKNF